MQNTKPKTAGKLIKQNDLRAYAKCSEYYHRGGSLIENFGTRVVRGAVERLTILCLKKEVKEPLKDIEACLLASISEVNQEEQIISSQLSHYMNACMWWLKEFFDIFSFEKYEPVYGPFTPKIRVSKTAIQLHVSGLFRSKKNQTIHAVVFSSHAGKHSVLNDPTMILNLKLLEPFVKKHVQSGRPNVVLHIFAFGKNNNLQYYTCNSNDLSKSQFTMVESLVKQMEAGHHYPVVPCLHRCPFKEKCFPGVKDV